VNANPNYVNPIPEIKEYILPFTIKRIPTRITIEFKSANDEKIELDYKFVLIRGDEYFKMNCCHAGYLVDDIYMSCEKVFVKYGSYANKICLDGFDLSTTPSFNEDSSLLNLDDFLPVKPQKVNILNRGKDGRIL
jgi:hypothetical protein